MKLCHVLNECEYPSSSLKDMRNIKQVYWKDTGIFCNFHFNNRIGHRGKVCPAILTHSVWKRCSLCRWNNLAIDPGAGCCVREAGNAPPCLTLIDAFVQLVSGSGPAAGDLGPHLPSCRPPTSLHAWLDSHHGVNIHLVHPSNLQWAAEKMNKFRVMRKSKQKNNTSWIKDKRGISKLCFLPVEKKTKNQFLFKIYANFSYCGMEWDICTTNHQYFDNSSYFWNKYFLNKAGLLSLNSIRQIILVQDFKTGITNNKLNETKT